MIGILWVTGGLLLLAAIAILVGVASGDLHPGAVLIAGIAGFWGMALTGRSPREVPNERTD